MINSLYYKVGVFLHANNIVGCNHGFVECLKVCSVIVGDAVHLSELPDALDELVSGAGKLGLEEREPEELSVNALGEHFADLSLKIWVNDVFHVDLIKIVGPRVEHLEALVLDFLLSVPLDVVL